MSDVKRETADIKDAKGSIVGTGTYGVVTLLRSKSDPSPSEKLRKISEALAEAKDAKTTILTEGWQAFPKVQKKLKDKKESKIEIDIEAEFLNRSRLFLPIEDTDKTETTFNMEEVSGIPLDEVSQEGLKSLSFVERTRLMLQLVQQLHHLHSIGIIHGDVKPGNVMITEPYTIVRSKKDGKSQQEETTIPYGARLVDFGLSHLIKLKEGQEADEQVVSMIGGNPAYFAPEVFASPQSYIGMRTDTYMSARILLKLFDVENPCKSRDKLCRIEYEPALAKYDAQREALKQIQNKTSKEYISAKREIDKSRIRIHQLESQIAKTKYDSEISGIPYQQCSTSLLELSLKDVIRLFIDRMQHDDYLKRPKDDEVLKFFSLLHQFACCPKNATKEKARLGSRLYYLAMGQRTAEQDQEYNSQYAGDITQSLEPKATQPSKTEVIRSPGKKARWSREAKALLGVITSLLLVNGGAAATIAICYDNAPKKTLDFLNKKIDGFEVSNLEAIIAVAIVLTAIIAIGGIYWYRNSSQRIAEMHDMPALEPIDTEQSTAPKNAKEQTPSAMR